MSNVVGWFAARSGGFAAALVLAVATVLAALPAQAQQDPPSRVGRLARLQGTVSFHTADQQQWEAATLNYPVTDGSAVWTEPGSRAAVQIDSNSIELNGETELDIVQVDDRVFAATVAQGEVFVVLRYVEPGDSYVIDTPRGRVILDQPGRYEIVSGDERRSTRVIVFDGNARVTGDNVNVPVSRGQQLLIDGEYPQVRTAFSGIGQPDAFAAWVNANVRDPVAPPPAVRGMTGVQDLGQYGQWDTAPEYGQIWYPQVQAGWVPYREGRWAWVEPWGWTWVAVEPWGFAPFHYGRWVEVRGRWGWVPIVVTIGRPWRPVYAPALVTFFGNIGHTRVGIGLGGPVGWVPLAPYEVYRPYYRTSPRYVQNINVTYVKNVTNITVINNNYNNADQFRNRRGFTAVDADVLRGSKPVRGSEHRFNDDDIKKWRVTNVSNDVKPGKDTIGVTPTVARKFNIEDADKKTRNAPGPKIEASKGTALQFKKFDDNDRNGRNDDKNKGGVNGNNGPGKLGPNANTNPGFVPNNGKGGDNQNGNDERRFKGSRTPGSPVNPGGNANVTPTDKGKGGADDGDKGKKNFGPVNNQPGTQPKLVAPSGPQDPGKGNTDKDKNDKPKFKSNVDRTPGTPPGGSGNSNNGNANNPPLNKTYTPPANNPPVVHGPPAGSNNDNGFKKNKGGDNGGGNARIVTPPDAGKPKGSDNGNAAKNSGQQQQIQKVQPQHVDPPKPPPAHNGGNNKKNQQDDDDKKKNRN